MYKQTPEQIREHYEIEVAIASRLRGSTAEDRKALYTAAYDELFRRVPHHPLLHGSDDPERERRRNKEVVALLPMLAPESVFAEIGPGDCSVSIALAGKVRRVYAIDVSNEVTKNAALPPNMELVIFDGITLPLPDASLDAVYSNQLMEHLHPDDAAAQIESIYAKLKPGGFYYCVTPNRLTGPHDVSRGFDDIATGLHLKEYTVSELARLLRSVGFRRVRTYWPIGGLRLALPALPFRVLEALTASLPGSIRRALTYNRVVRYLFGIKILATK